jgi:4-hydroxy-2-oxoglutarate aldolase
LGNFQSWRHSGLKADISKNFGYGGPYVRGPLKAINPDHLEEQKYYKTLAVLIAIENSIP